MKRELGIARCGLACCLCSENASCKGCKRDGFLELSWCKDAEWCENRKCCIAKGVDAEIVEGLRNHFNGECSEVGMYLAMARQAMREGYAEIAVVLEQIAKEEAEHASRFGEMLGELVGTSTKANIEKMLAGENGACHGKMAIAKKAKELNLDAIHDSVHEMARDEARHGKALEGLLKRYF